MYRIRIYVNGEYAYTTTAASVKAAIAHLRRVGVVTVASVPKNWIIAAKPEDRIIGEIVFKIER